MMSRVGERNRLLRVAILVGIQHNQAIVIKIFGNLHGQTFKRSIVRDKTTAGTDNHQKMIEADLLCK